MVTKNVPILLALISLTLNNLVLKAPTVFVYEENIRPLHLPESLLEGNQADVHFWSGHCPALGCTTKRD